MDTEPMENSSTNVDTAGDTLTTIDLDELQSAYDTKCEEIRTQLQLQIEEQRTAMAQMKHQLQLDFERQLQQLELKMEQNATKLFQDFGQRFQVVMEKIEELVVDRTELKAMLDDKLSYIIQALTNKQDGDITPTNGNTPSRPHKVLRATPSPNTNMEKMNIDPIPQADGSLITNPTASHANHRDGSIASAGAKK